MFVEKEVTVELWKPPGPFTVLADVYLLDRLMQNLYSNAAKYSQKNGHVVLSFENNEVENESVLCFFNAGRPIPEEFRNTLFDKYSRMDGHSTQYSKGLGLFFCQMVMLAHGGRIWLDTDEKGNYFKLGFKREKAILVPNETCEESEQTTSLKTAGMAGMLSMMGLGL